MGPSVPKSQTEMVAEMIVRNTFIHFVEAEQSRRSHSLPRSWKPLSPDACALPPTLATLCVAREEQASTADIDYELRTDYGDCEQSAEEFHNTPSMGLPRAISCPLVGEPRMMDNFFRMIILRSGPIILQTRMTRGFLGHFVIRERNL
jgi:hypothetical protein